VVDRAVLQRRVAALRNYLTLLRQRYGGQSLEAFQKDEIGRLAAERLLQLAAECCIDIANHVVADRGGAQPETYREAFASLGQMGVIPEDLARVLENVAGMRNVLVHGYLVIDPAKVHYAIVHGLDDLGRFAQLVSRLV
jgi:uncharacterized protein YutE (UPF0331/DUF86 family)